MHKSRVSVQLAAAFLLSVASILAEGSVSHSVRLSLAAPVTVRLAAARVPPSQLVQKGKLLVCSDFPAPPQEMYNAKSQPVGSDVDTGNEIGRRLGLKTVWVNTVFDTIIEAVSTGKCDIAMSGIFITPPRLKQVDMIPYFAAGESFLVKKGNPNHLSDPGKKPLTLCGKTLSLQLGSAETDQAKTWSKHCGAVHKPAINFLVSSKVSDALQQVGTGRAAALFFDSPTNGYYAKLHADQFTIQGSVINNIQEGIVVAKGKRQLEAAVKTEMKIIEKNGVYAKILKKWGEDGAKIPRIR